MSHEELVFNGIALSGDHAFPRLTEEEVASLALREKSGDELLREILEEEGRQAGRRWRRDPPQGIDPGDLSRTGWGVIFSEDTPPGVRRALADLLEHRRDQATCGGGDFYHEFVYPSGTRTAKFLLENGATPCETADPRRLPYYLLLVGSPEEIPYKFQYELNLQYAVGRIHFERSEEYARYGDRVIRAERRVSRPRRVAFFGVENEGDSASADTAEGLVAGLADKLDGYRSGWDVSRYLKAEASKSRLEKLLGGEETPALLFAGGHGLVLPRGHEAQEDLQGALLCSDWPDPSDPDRAIAPEHFFAARDLEDRSTELEGLIAFFFACYGAGTPEHGDFDLEVPAGDRKIARRPFLSRLSRGLLSGGALSMIGHVERTWMSAFRWPDGALQIETFGNVLKRLLDGHPVGSALSPFAVRHGQLSAQLKNLDDQRTEEPLGRSERQLYSRLWRGNRDARNFVVVGDPAVRLSV